MDWDDFEGKDDCTCGHMRFQHGSGGQCAKTKVVTDEAALPTPVYDDNNGPFSPPVNWPPPAELPQIEVPCGCTQFSDLEPSEPDWSMYDEESGT